MKGITDMIKCRVVVTYPQGEKGLGVVVKKNNNNKTEKLLQVRLTPLYYRGIPNLNVK